MENRWILIIALIVLACVTLQVTAYDNVKAHPIINRCAIDYFEKNIAPYDPLLKGTSIREEGNVAGYAWDYTGGDSRVRIGGRDSISKPKDKHLVDWIVDGGFSADEPEYTMALVHFYDPKNPYKAYLTDQQFLVKFGELYWDGQLINPEISAVDWAFDRDLGSGYYIQDYSWNDGLRYYREALASPSCCNEKYGQAWRAVGETMHLISDMTVPAHVRNDGHAWSDPYEDSVSKGMVEKYYDSWRNALPDGGQPLPLNYDQGTLRDLMVRIATKVNEEFYSADTTPTGYRVSGSDSFSYTPGRYSQPSLKGLTADANGYYYSPVAGALAREVLYYCKPTSPPKYTYTDPNANPIVLVYGYNLDEKVLTAQRRVLIPTAIRASAEVLDRFLPRFEATLLIDKTDPDNPNSPYFVDSTLMQVRTNPDAWSGYDDLIVRNGAYIAWIPPGSDKVKYSEAMLLGPDNRYNNIMTFEPGTKVYMYYDLGGYVIKSNEVVIPKVTPTTPDMDWEREPWVETTYDPTIRMCGDIPCSQLPSPGRVSPDWTPPPRQ